MDQLFQKVKQIREMEPVMSLKEAEIRKFVHSKYVQHLINFLILDDKEIEDYIKNVKK